MGASKFVFVFVTLFCLGSGQLSEQLDAVVEQYGLMGLSVLTLCNAEVTNIYHNGLKDYTRKLEIDNNTIYRMASISKIVTATGMMMLYEDGVFDLDDDISTALGYQLRNPNWPDVPITYRMVLSHTSSIQDGPAYVAFLEDTEASIGAPPSMKEILLPGGEYYTEDTWRPEAPGSYFSYSNLGYGVVGKVIEALTGMRFDVYMKERLLNRLGVAGSFNVRDVEVIDDLAALYINDNGWSPQYDNYQGIRPEPLNMTNYVPGTNGLQFSPVGGLRITPLDLQKIMKLHFFNGSWEGEQLLDESVMQLMHEDQWTSNGLNGDTALGFFQAYGLGIHHFTNTPNGDIIFPDRQMYGHKGGNYGLISGFYYDMIKGSGVIFATNGISSDFALGQYSALSTLEESILTAAFENLSC